jgi:hypothetical protein
MSNLERLIYNTYLKYSRGKLGMPYRVRKHWEGFETSTAFPKVNKLKNFFSRNQNVSIEDFFNAPYTIYPGESGFDLDFYASQKAIKIYSLFLKKQMHQLSPDDDFHLKHISKGLKFILEFCRERGIEIDDYIAYKDGVQSSFIVHIKERKISLYNLFGFNQFEKYFYSNDPDVVRFTLGELYDSLPIYRTKYLASKKAKSLVVLGLKKIKNNIS